MKKDKNFYLNLLLIISAPLAVISGAMLVVLCNGKNRLVALGYLLILLGVFLFLMWGMRMLAFRSINKEKRKAENERKQKMNDALCAFENAPDAELNTVKLVDAGMEFSAVGRYVCEKDFKGVSGHHFAFEIASTALKYKPKNYDDVCNVGDYGIHISVGYHDGEALEPYANDNGVILQDTLKYSVGSTITLAPNDGYNVCVWTVEGDEIDYGFVKIIKCENDVVTVRFSLNVPFGLADTVVGVVQLEKEVGEDAQDIHSLISRVMWRRYNTINVSAEQIAEIKQANPFLPESYLEFLSKVGFADMNWIDLGFDNRTPTNLRNDDTEIVQDFCATHKEYRLDDYYFIAVDNDGGYYAFSRNSKDRKVYCFSHEDPQVFTYESFETFLTEILNA